MHINGISVEEKIPRIEKEITSSFTGKKRTLIEKAFSLAHEFFDGTLRKNGEPGMIHPVMVALRISKLGFGANTIAASILHDMIEDNGNISDMETRIRKETNDDVANLVRSLSIIRNNSSEKATFQDELTALLHFMSLIKDLRVLAIKISDVLHNIETIEGLAPERQVTFLEEAEKLYLPAAECLGIATLQKMIETAIFKHRHPHEYHEISSYISSHVERGSAEVEKLISELNEVISLSDVKATAEGRIKSIPSIHKKLIKYSKEGKPATITNLLDILAFRILTRSEEDCYKVLSALAALYPIKENMIDDYIAKPKPNGYKSLHVIALNEKEFPIEIQIETNEMHEFNEFGSASHLSYKMQGKRNAALTSEFDWVTSINRKMKDYSRFEDNPIPISLFEDCIFVLTPKNMIFKLPVGSTVVDLAFEIHTDLGNHCTGAQINGKTVSPTHIISSGDVVEILENPKQKYPNLLWLRQVKTSKAKLCINRAARKQH